MTPLQLCENKADAVVVQIYSLYQLDPPMILLTKSILKHTPNRI